MAKQLGITASTVRWRASRGRLLREEIRAGGRVIGMYKLPPDYNSETADAESASPTPPDDDRGGNA